MAENVLYYPYIRVPNNAWFTRVLLYWDSVGSIVPYEYADHPERLGQYMQSLLTEGLVKQIFPGSYIYKVPRFVDAFIETAEEYKRNLQGRTRRLLNHTTSSRVHMEKLDDLGPKLCRMGLAKEAGYPWYDIHSQLANKFMAYLAGILSSLPDIHSRPITDEREQLEIYESPGNYRSVILEELLPAPNESVTATELAHFKAKNQKYLITFRNEIELFILHVASVPDHELRNKMVDRFITKTKNDIDGLIELMKSQGWQNISLGRFLSYAAAGVTLADAIATGGLLATIAAAFGIGASACTTYQDSQLPDNLRTSYTAYAALAKVEYDNGTTDSTSA
jgi:hypothetical protein